MVSPGLVVGDQIHGAWCVVEAARSRQSSACDACDIEDLLCFVVRPQAWLQILMIMTKPCRVG